MKIIEKTLPSKDVHAVLHTVIFTPDKPETAKGMIQICHGMTEHMGRYAEFAEYFTDKGYIVFGNDCISHGKSKTTESSGLYFADWFDVTADAQTVRNEVIQKYPNLPVYLLGFSLGSFVVRTMPTLDGYEKEILIGTGYQPAGVMKLMRKLLSLKFAKRMHVSSDEIKNMAFDANNKKFPKQPNEYWLITDDALRAQYQADALVKREMTPKFFCEFLKGMACAADQLKHPNNTIPTLFLSGKNDPVGDFGKGVKKVFDAYKKNNPDTKFAYLDGTHDILHDAMRKHTFDVICRFIEGE